MSKRRIIQFNPGLEPLEAKRLLSAGGSATPLAAVGTTGATPASDPVETTTGVITTTGAASPDAVKPLYGYLVFRITQPSAYNDALVPPYGQVLVQSAQPVPGQVYNVLQIVVRNGTTKTFTAADGFTVHLSGQKTNTPILTGNEVWKPGQWFIFYVLTKKYYPIHNVIAGGFVFNMGGAKSVAIPGPSGIFLRVTYNPATFPKTLDWIVTHGPGSEGGTGIRTGMADTALYEFLPSVTARHDFGGYF